MIRIISCSERFYTSSGSSSFSSQLSRTHLVQMVRCPKNCYNRYNANLYGDNVYTDFSYICQAAIHNGRITSNWNNWLVYQIFYCTRWTTRRTVYRVCYFAGPISTLLRTGHGASFEEMLQRWRPLATLCPILPARDLNLRPPAPKTNALPADRVASWSFYPLANFFRISLICLGQKTA